MGSRILDFVGEASSCTLFIIAFVIFWGSLIVLALVFGYHGPQAPPICKYVGQTSSDTILTGYHAIITPVDISQGVFKISEEATYNVESYLCNSDYSVSTSIMKEGEVLSLPEKQVYSSSRGLFIRELNVTPLDGLAISGIDTCCVKAPTVELSDFPRDSFYEARDVNKTEISTYLDIETVKFDEQSLNRSIVFAYITPPFYSVRGLVAPLIGVSYQGQWIVALIGLLVTVIIVPFAKDVLVDLTVARIKSLFKRNKSKKKRESSSF